VRHTLTTYACAVNEFLRELVERMNLEQADQYYYTTCIYAAR